SACIHRTIQLKRFLKLYCGRGSIACYGDGAHESTTTEKYQNDPREGTENTQRPAPAMYRFKTDIDCKESGRILSCVAAESKVIRDSLFGKGFTGFRHVDNKPKPAENLSGWDSYIHEKP